MSWMGKALWALSLLSFLILFFARVYLGGWINLLFVPLLTSLLALVSALFIDSRYYAVLLTTRSSRYGMSVGFSLSVFFVLLIGFNILSVSLDKSVDLSTANKNTLSVESSHILAAIDSKVIISTYYRGKKDKAQLSLFKQSLAPFVRESSFVQLSYVDIYKDSVRAKLELKDVPNEDKAVVLVKYKNKKIQVSHPINEENIAQALLLATRTSSKNIFFLTGQGERELNSEGSSGLLGLQQVLVSKGFNVTSSDKLNRDSLQPLSDSAVALVGSRFQLSLQVISQLIDFVNNGGHLLVAADPSKQSNINELTRHFGLQFENNFVVSEVGSQFGRSPTTAVGIAFNKDSQITRGFAQSERSFALFETASQVSQQPVPGYNLVPLIASPQQSFTVEELKLKLSSNETGRKNLAMHSESLSDKSGHVIVIGDSDFLTNKDLLQGVNKQLAINIMSFLTNENDLLLKVPSLSMSHQVILTDRLRSSIIVAGFFVPFSLFLFAGILFYRRRGA